MPVFARAVELTPSSAFSPRLVSSIPSRGVAPASIAEHRGRVYVLNSGGTPNVAAFSYGAGAHGALRNVTASPAVGQGATCWVAVSPSGRFDYTGNASPRDLAFDASRRHLRAVSPGTAAAGDQVTTYRLGHDGSLSVVGTAPAAAGITGAAAM